jgi:hypothetical protein
MSRINDLLDVTSRRDKSSSHLSKGSKSLIGGRLERLLNNDSIFVTLFITETNNSNF